MKKHFVEFYSPGTFVSEISVREVASWDPDTACELARGIKERYNATPYGFRFFTREREPNDLDSHVRAKSQMYYLGGKIETLDEVEARNDPKEEILRSNMRGNGWNRIITNTNSWKHTAPFYDGDVLLNWEP